MTLLLGSVLRGAGFASFVGGANFGIAAFGGT